VLFSRRRHLLSFELYDSPNLNLLPGLNSWDHYRMRPGSWDIGEIKLCRKVELKSDPNLSTETILLCGADTTITWDILVREDQHPTAEYPPEVRSRAKLTLSIAPIQNDMLYGCPVLLRT
jgi:hypothetical protein